MSNDISRREAIRRMVMAGAGLAAAGTILDSCSDGKKKSASVVKEAPEGTTVTTRKWDSLGGESISLLGLGCMRLPQMTNGGRGLDQEQVNKMVDYSLAHGINYFDTAPAYGQSEKVMGVALSRHPRNTYKLATKMSNMNYAPGTKVTVESAQKMMETSLANLQTDYFDYYLLHNISDEASFKVRFIDSGVLDYLIELRQKGVIKHLGFSYHGNDEFFGRLVDQYYKWEFVQIQMNYTDWENNTNMWGNYGGMKSTAKYQYELLEQKGIPVVVMEPIKGGALANVSEALETKLAERFPSLSPAGCALSFVASHPSIMCTLSGMSNMEQLQENVATFTDFKEMSGSDLEFMNEMAVLYNANKHVGCTACEYCMPCPNGVNIPGNFKVYNTTSDELNIPDPENQGKDYKKKRKILLKRYKALGDASADACTKCDACLPKCPQKIRIPDQLQMIRDLIDSIA